ncbi:MAG TPA: HEAT repeat domain-containing protein [Thermoanaerobaculia bacterium]|nr:HEAT repeat domain-containing protein [Thermoanaerobaculia bacterium]
MLRLACGVALALAIGCASHPPPNPMPAAAPETPAVVPTPPPRPYATLDEARPALMSLEDRRAYDAGVLQAAARSSDPTVRARAVLAAGRIGDPRGAELVRPLLADPDASVREAAAFAAGILGEPGLTTALVPLFGDPEPRVAARAAWSLGFLEQETGRRALIDAIPAAAAPEPRAAFLRALWRFATPDAAEAALRFASDGDPRVRTAALYALARKPQEASLPALTACLRDPDAAAAALCARALGVLGKPESIPPLSAALESTGPVAIFSMSSLSQILAKNAGAAPPAERRERVIALSSDVSSNLAVPALELLRAYASERDAFRRLWTVASAGRGRRQQAALQSLMTAVPQQSATLVDAAIGSPDPFLRAAAAESLSSLAPDDAATARGRLAADPEAVVRGKLLDGLKTADAVRAARPLVDAALADPDAGVRASALDALARLDAETPWPVFRDAVVQSAGDAAPDVPIEAIGAASARPDDPGAREVVDAAYKHPSTLVSRLARKALVKTFHADPASLPLREYLTQRTLADYAAIAARARRPWVARVETEKGVFTVRLGGSDSPMTVDNFLTLADKKYFDGARIHRVVPGFVVQDGDPTGTGNGGPGWEIRDELVPTPYRTGTVGMALSGPDTGGSQWFATQAPQPHLDGIYTAFGQVASGMDVVMRIEQGDRIYRVTVGEEQR